MFKSKFFWGSVKHESEKAILFDGVWLPKSQIVSRTPVDAESNDGGRSWDDPSDPEFIEMAFPVPTGGDSSGHYTIRLDDGRIFEKNGFNGWSEQGNSPC